MKVLFIAPANSIHTVRWVNALVSKGLEIVLVSLKNHKNLIDKIDEKVKVLYLSILGTKGYYLNAPQIKQIYDQEKPDVVNAHYASGYGTLTRIAKIPNVILSVWGSDVYEFPYQSRFKMYIIKKNLRYAAKIASTSRVMATQVKKICPELSEIAITPFGVDIERFNFKETNSEDFTVGIVKTLSKNYGVDIVIQAFSEFYCNLSVEEKSQYKKICLLIYGEGEDKCELQALVKRLGISKNVCFGGYISNSDVPDAIKKMNVFCLGSRLESFGVSAVEAMACGVPVIATDADGFKEVIEHGESGFIVSKGSYSDMAKYLYLLFKNQDLSNDISLKGRKRVEKLFNWEKNVNIMLGLYAGSLK